MTLPLIVPDWTAPPGVRAVVTTRVGGVSKAPYDSLNLATHVGDDPSAVAENRRLLREALRLPAEPLWLDQVHGIDVCDASRPAAACRADAAYVDRPGVVLAVLTADCLPVLLASLDGREIGVAHAGWRGLADGVLEALLDCFSAPPEKIVAWLGPAIGPTAFEVGDEVRAAFLAHAPGAARAFVPTRSGHWLTNLYLLARQRLAARGIHAVWGGVLCTTSDPARFYSYRRDGVTGRMASLIWRDS
ncbi:MAG: peptidoglycan editing factor PgeF [Halothiobacillaceae bacterium]